MKKILPFLALLAWLVPPAFAADPIFPPGSSIGLVPPPGLKTATGFAGFQDEAKSISFVTISLPAMPFDEIVKGFSDDKKLLERGITPETREQITVNGSPALLVSGHQQTPTATYRKWMLIVGSPNATAMVSAQYTDTTAWPDAVIRAALTSVVVRPAVSNADQMAALPFTLKPAPGYQSLLNLGGMVVMMVKGDPTPGTAHSSALMVLYAATKSTPDERDTAARLILSQRRDEPPLELGPSRNLTLAGLPAIEIVAKGTNKKGTLEKHIQWAVFAPEGVLIIRGIADAPLFEGEMPAFIAMRDSVRLK